MMNFNKIFAGVAAAVLATAVVAAPAQAAERTATIKAPKNVEVSYIGEDLVAIGLKDKVAEYAFLNSEEAKEKLDSLVCDTFRGAQEYDFDAAKKTGSQYEIRGNVTTEGEFNASANIEAFASIEGNKGINFCDNVNVNTTADKFVMYSGEGDIIFRGNNLNLKGLIFAPNGNVAFNSDYVNLNDCVVIAKHIDVDEEIAQFNFNGSNAVNDMLAVRFGL